MRCTQCNVDLGERCEVCPLCGAPAAQEPPVLQDILQADYPAAPKAEKKKKADVKPNRRVFRVIGVLSLLFTLSGNAVLYNGLGAVLLIGVTVYLFVCALKETGEMLHGAVGVLGCLALELALVLLHLLLHSDPSVTLFAAIVSFALLVILYVFRTERFSTQMQAFLRR